MEEVCGIPGLSVAGHNGEQSMNNTEFLAIVTLLFHQAWVVGGKKPDTNFILGVVSLAALIGNLVEAFL
jgi:hypothetical protein